MKSFIQSLINKLNELFAPRNYYFYNKKEVSQSEQKGWDKMEQAYKLMDEAMKEFNKAFK